MSNVRSRQTKNALCRCRSELRLSPRFRRCQNQRQQEAVPLSRQSSLVASLCRSRHHLGRPSVGGRLTAGAAGAIFQVTAVLKRGASVPEPAWLWRHRVYQSAACLAKPQGFCALRRVGTLLRMHPLYGSTSIEPGAPAPNHSIERTCLKPLRAFSPTAHVER